MLPRSHKAKFAAAIGRMLRPVIRQLIAYGVSYPVFDRMVRRLYVEVAEQDFTLAFKRQTDSRLALVTGMNRKEIAQLRQERAAMKGEREVREVEETVTTRVIGRWMAGPPYAIPDGTPRRLPYESDDPRAVTFARLVRQTTPDIPVRSVLDELLRVGAAELLPDGDVVLHGEAQVHLSGAEEKLALLASDPSEVFATIMHNIENAGAPRLQRKVVYDNIGSDALVELRAEARRVGEEFIRRANALLASYDRDRNPDAPAGKRSRVVLGAYYFEEEARSPQTSPARGGPPHPPGRIRRSR
jgi:Family of unknown function (DUF6502)